MGRGISIDGVELVDGGVIGVGLSAVYKMSSLDLMVLCVLVGGVLDRL